MLAQKLHAWLRTAPTPEADNIIAEALRYAEPEWHARLVDILLERRTESSYGALVGRFASLPDSVRSVLLADETKFGIGIALAARSRDPDARLSAMAALEAQPSPRMAYVLPENLRHPAASVRAAAARVLRAMALRLLSFEPPENGDPTRPAYFSDRRSLASAALEGLRTYDLHHRVEVIESALWLAQDIGAPLWTQLTNHRSRVGMAVAENLPTWDSPLLTWFLLRTLRVPEWRSRAMARLAAPSGPRQLVELLRASDLLDDPEIRKHIQSIRAAKWFGRDVVSTDVPPHLQPMAPRWMVAMHGPAAEKVGRLVRWLGSAHGEFRTACVYALAEIDDPQAMRPLRELADGFGPLPTFARWCVAGREAASERRGIGAPRETGRGIPRPRVEIPPEPEVDASLATLWQACRRTSVRDRGEVIEAIRENADIWRYKLAGYSRSPDPRDRLLALQVLSTRELSLQFRREITALSNDSVEGIRSLASMLLGGLPGDPTRQRPAPRAGGSSLDAVETAYTELGVLLAEIASQDEGAQTAALVTRVRELLRLVHEPVNAATPPGSAEKGQGAA
jgi:hypothetical protein